jgi:hypothetical protein
MITAAANKAITPLSKAGQLDWWVKERLEWLGGVRGGGTVSAAGQAEAWHSKRLRQCLVKGSICSEGP